VKIKKTLVKLNSGPVSRNFNATGMTWFKLLQNPVETLTFDVAAFP
jgi:hypothetical protein